MKRKSFPEAMHEIENNPDIKTREQLIAEGAVTAEGVVTAELMGTESDEIEKFIEEAEDYYEDKFKISPPWMIEVTVERIKLPPSLQVGQTSCIQTFCVSHSCVRREFRNASQIDARKVDRQSLAEEISTLFKIIQYYVRMTLGDTNCI